MTHGEIVFENDVAAYIRFNGETQRELIITLGKAPSGEILNRLNNQAELVRLIDRQLSKIRNGNQFSLD